MASKAAAWAERATELLGAQAQMNVVFDTEKPRFRLQRHPGEFIVPGEVTSRGSLAVGNSGITLTPEQAIAYARWILDTFGEPETKENAS